MPEPTEQRPDPRGDFDQQLQVASWSVPTIVATVVEDLPAGAPTWWHGEEEATDAFMRAMGVKFGPDGEVIRR